ncbi:hypothetical protein JCM30471_09660 [Desulfuromonas carbonis]|uniref:L,D-transpeptidase family protein n=1 Tax=Desulfuromonas sp. DDH964 TaxID=1823759 RepID=UPI00078C7EEF|nr:L,D-transpeptidase [Desulfuromonas sp. DDH964]AMV72451.1 peptidoglycan L,D-transpeptidase lipoprotein, YkuD family, TPR domain-containing [Desulfuromonas sp. DDH964]
MSCFHFLKTGLLIVALATLVGCKEPPVPPEVPLALRQEQDLWRAGASVYAPGDYAAYKVALEAARDLLNHERSRMVWLRDYDPVALRFRAVLQQGEGLQQQIAAVSSAESAAARERLEQLAGVLRLLRDLADELKDGRLAGRRLAIAEVDLGEARRLMRAGEVRAAAPLLDRASREIREKVRLVLPLVARFGEPLQLRQWRRMVDDSIAEARRQGDYLLIVSKLEREVIVYRGDREIRRYPAGFGFNLLSDKLHAGDKATPEGRYRVVRKNPQSRYFKALLLDYPNTEDRRRFLQAKREGKIPAHAGIGSLIEIHGGGRKGLTNGCVALEDGDMATLFELVPVGTAVTIVGSLRPDNPLAVALRELK